MGKARAGVQLAAAGGGESRREVGESQMQASPTSHFRLRPAVGTVIAFSQNNSQEGWWGTEQS